MSKQPEKIDSVSPDPNDELKPSVESSAVNSSAGAADSGSDSASNNSGGDNKAARSQIRAAVSSAYGTQPLNPDRVLDPADKLIEQAQQLVKKGNKDEAIQLFSQAVALKPTNSDAWMWLGGMLIDHNLERAHFCLQRAVELNPQNQRAKRGLASVTAALKISTEIAETENNENNNDVAELSETGNEGNEGGVPAHLAIVPTEKDSLISSDTTNEVIIEDGEKALTIASTDGEQLLPDRTTKIGVEEAVAVLREAGIETDPENVPIGGAKIREGLESGTLVAGKHGYREAKLYGIRLTITLLLGLGLVAALGIWLLVAQPDIQSVISPPTPVPTPVLTANQKAADQLRVAFSNYNLYFNNFRSLTQQAVNGKLSWPDFQTQFTNLANQIRSETASVNGIARNITPDLLETYKELQDVAASANVGTEYTLSGIENQQPEDLQAGINNFNKASNLLSDAAQKLQQVVPASATSSITNSPLMTPAPTDGSNVTSTATSLTTTSSTATNLTATSSTSNGTLVVTPGTPAPASPPPVLP